MWNACGTTLPLPNHMLWDSLPWWPTFHSKWVKRVCSVSVVDYICTTERDNGQTNNIIKGTTWINHNLWKWTPHVTLENVIPVCYHGDQWVYHFSSVVESTYQCVVYKIVICLLNMNVTMAHGLVGVTANYIIDNSCCEIDLAISACSHQPILPFWHDQLWVFCSPVGDVILTHWLCRAEHE